MTIQDRPTAAELVAALREFLEIDVPRATDGRVAFHARVAANVAAMLERELAHGRHLDTVESARLTALLGREGDLRELLVELAARIRDSSLDDRRAEVVAVVREQVRAKLAVANPRYLEQ